MDLTAAPVAVPQLSWHLVNGGHRTRKAFPGHSGRWPSVGPHKDKAARLLLYLPGFCKLIVPQIKRYCFYRGHICHIRKRGNKRKLHTPQKKNNRASWRWRVGEVGVEKEEKMMVSPSSTARMKRSKDGEIAFPRITPEYFVLAGESLGGPGNCRPQCEQRGPRWEHPTPSPCSTGGPHTPPVLWPPQSVGFHWLRPFLCRCQRTLSSSGFSTVKRERALAVR